MSPAELKAYFEHEAKMARHAVAYYEKAGVTQSKAWEAGYAKANETAAALLGDAAETAEASQ